MEEFSEPDYSEQELRTIEFLKVLSKNLRRTFRPPVGKRLEQFCFYFSAFTDERLASFASKLAKTSAATNPEFKLDYIVSKDMINSIIKAPGAQRSSSKSFYDIQIMEV